METAPTHRAAVLTTVRARAAVGAGGSEMLGATAAGCRRSGALIGLIALVRLSRRIRRCGAARVVRREGTRAGGQADDGQTQSDPPQNRLRYRTHERQNLVN